MVHVQDGSGFREVRRVDINARVAAHQLDAFIARRDHYDSVLVEMRKIDAAVEPDRMLAGAKNARFEQMRSLASELRQLADDAMEQGGDDLEDISIPPSYTRHPDGTGKRGRQSQSAGYVPRDEQPVAVLGSRHRPI